MLYHACFVCGMLAQELGCAGGNLWYSAPAWPVAGCVIMTLSCSSMVVEAAGLCTTCLLLYIFKLSAVNPAIQAR
jgi:hypothetical protein